jgi:Vacuolar import and degradation protein
VPGAVFEGQQRAHTPGDFLSVYDPSPRWESDWRAESANSSRREYLPRFTLDEASRQWTSSNVVPPHAQRTRSSRLPGPTKADFWPVKVKIHAVDYERMTLAATMEAYDVPSQPPVPDYLTNMADDFWATTAINHDPTSRAPAVTPKKEERKSITTYLEGEILDFKNFTFMTESFKSSLDNDATYWRKLEPFKDYTDEELVGRLTSKGYLEHLSQSYILMRWKERCFVRDSPSKSQASLSSERVHVYGSSGTEARDAVDFYEAVEMPDGFTGLTISGFYYVCMRRSDGAVEGLYCDPQSSPYQRLTLERKGEAELGRFPVWEFK